MILFQIWKLEIEHPLAEEMSQCIHTRDSGNVSGEC